MSLFKDRPFVHHKLSSLFAWTRSLVLMQPYHLHVHQSATKPTNNKKALYIFVLASSKELEENERVRESRIDDDDNYNDNN